MDDIKAALKAAIKTTAEQITTSAGLDPEGTLMLAQSVANLTNSLSGITVIEDQELHNAAIGKQEFERGAGPTH